MTVPPSKADRDADVEFAIDYLLFPFIAIWVAEFKASMCVFESYTRSALIVHIFRQVGVAAIEHHSLWLFAKRDADVRWLVVARAMLESILDE